MEQAQKTANPRDRDDEETPEVEAKDERNEKLSDDVDDILDEIDAVLEPNAEKFVAQYIQKGGQ
jgi:prokaryotic ubiquitin-like protein Pup